ncbi:hypothetical protein ACFXJ8_19955 [Nonomuraea sp. NPDC059194]|uniref:hypothetical protein n=1 Tax=Nonomuraea sp. NPDC059194 TaxID=3346764 RepID=UPI00367B8D4B
MESAVPGFTIDPSRVKEGQTAVLEFSVREDTDMTVAGIWTGVSAGPVAECALVDDPNGFLGPDVDAGHDVFLQGKG